jgi:hypothetical protein
VRKILNLRVWEMETGKKVHLEVGDKMNSNLNGINIADFEVWTGRPAEEFYDPLKKKAVKNPEFYQQHIFPYTLLYRKTANSIGA